MSARQAVIPPAAVIPAQAGIQFDIPAYVDNFTRTDLQTWIPACAGMTELNK